MLIIIYLWTNYGNKELEILSTVQLLWRENSCNSYPLASNVWTTARMNRHLKAYILHNKTIFRFGNLQFQFWLLPFGWLRVSMLLRLDSFLLLISGHFGSNSRHLAQRIRQNCFEFISPLSLAYNFPSFNHGIDQSLRTRAIVWPLKLWVTRIVYPRAKLHDVYGSVCLYVRWQYRGYLSTKGMGSIKNVKPVVVNSFIYI